MLTRNLREQSLSPLCSSIFLVNPCKRIFPSTITLCRRPLSLSELFIRKQHETNSHYSTSISGVTRWVSRGHPRMTSNDLVLKRVSSSGLISTFQCCGCTTTWLPICPTVSQVYTSLGLARLSLTGFNCIYLLLYFPKFNFFGMFHTAVQSQDVWQILNFATLNLYRRKFEARQRFLLVTSQRTFQLKSELNASRLYFIFIKKCIEKQNMIIKCTTTANVWKHTTRC